MPILENDPFRPIISLSTINRTFQISSFKNNIDKKLIIVEAGAGWGKTTLLTSYATALKHPYVWYTLSEKDRDPDLFLMHLYERIGRISSGMLSERRFTVEDVYSGKLDWISFGGNLLNSISRIYPRKLIVFLDDYHVVDQNEDLQRFFDDFIEQAPLNMQFIVSTRYLADSLLSKHKTYGQVFEVGADGLAFSYEECRLFFKQSYNVILPEEDVYELIPYTSGWPLAMRLIGEEMKSNDDLSSLNGRWAGRQINIDEYFEGQVMKGISPELKQVILESAIFESIDSDICRDILNWTDSEDILEQLFKQGLFLDRLETKGQKHPLGYHYHALFRQFLLDQLEQKTAPQNIKAINIRAGEYFVNKNRWAEALAHFIKAEAYEKSADVLVNAVAEIMSKGTARTLLYWINQLPQKVLMDFFPLLFGKGWACFISGDWTTAADSIQLCKEKVSYSEFPDLYELSVQHLLFLYFTQERHDDLIELADEVKQIVDDKSSLWAKVESMSLQAHMQKGNRLAASYALKNLDGHPGLTSNEDFLMESVSQTSINHYWLISDFDTAIADLNRTIDYFRKQDYMGRLGRSLFFLSLILYEMGRFKECYETVSESVHEMTAKGHYHTLNAALSIKVIALCALGRIDEANKEANALSRMITNNHIPNNWKTYLPACAKSQVALYKKDHTGFLTQAGKVIDALRSLALWSDETLIVAELATGYIQTGKTDFMIDPLTKAMTRAEKIGSSYRYARLNLLLAFAYYQKENLEGTKKYLETALSMSASYGYDYLFLLKHQDIASILLPVAFKERLCLDYTAHLLIRMDGNSGKYIIDKIKSMPEKDQKLLIRRLAKDECRDAENFLAQFIKKSKDEAGISAQKALLTIQKLPPLELNIQMLGAFSVRQGERVIYNNEWKRKTAVMIFKYMVAHAGKIIIVDRLIDHFFPDFTIDAARSQLHQAMSTIRKVLEPGIMPKRESAYIKSEEGAYRLILPPGSTIDVEQFDGLCRHGKAALDDGDETLTFLKYSEAISLYHGEFLATDIDSDWMVPFRDQLKKKYTEALFNVSTIHFNLFEYEKCIDYLARLIEIEPYDERAYYMLMRCYFALGDRADLIQTYQKCKKVLTEDLGIKPNTEITNIYHQALSA